MVEPRNNRTAKRAKATQEYVKSLYEIGREAYFDSQLPSTTKYLSNALSIAESINDSYEASHCRGLYGNTLMHLGKLREALSVLTPAMQASSMSSDPDVVVRILTDYIRIAVELPLSLKTIEKAHSGIEKYLRDIGHKDWQSGSLYVRAGLYTKRGLYRQALMSAQEGWIYWQNDYQGYLCDTHLDNLVETALHLRDSARARRYMEEWEQQKALSPKIREILLHSRRSDLARLEGQADKAIDQARQALLVVEITVDLTLNSSAIYSLLRSALLIRDWEQARNALYRLLAMRHSESRHIRYSTHLLRGDYHLARARQVAGMDPVDDEYGLDFPPPDRVANKQTTQHELVRARYAYDAALKLGRWIDEQLQCTLRQEELTKRYMRVEDIEKLI